MLEMLISDYSCNLNVAIESLNNKKKIDRISDQAVKNVEILEREYGYELVMFYIKREPNEHI